MCAVKCKLSAGPDSKPSIFSVKTLPLVYVCPVYNFYNYSYKYSVLPSDGKCAAVTSLLKNGEPCFVTNYTNLFDFNAL